MILGRSVEFNKQKRLIFKIKVDSSLAHKQKEFVRCSSNINKELTDDIYIDHSITINLMAPENPSAILHKTSITRQEVKEIKLKL